MQAQNDKLITELSLISSFFSYSIANKVQIEGSFYDVKSFGRKFKPKKADSFSQNSVFLLKT